MTGRSGSERRISVPVTALVVDDGAEPVTGEADTTNVDNGVERRFIDRVILVVRRRRPSATVIVSVVVSVPPSLSVIVYENMSTPHTSPHSQRSCSRHPQQRQRAK